MKKLSTLVACVALLSGCDFAGGSGESVAFSSVTLTESPLGTNLYVEVQDAGGRAVYQGEQITGVDESVLPYVVATDGEFLGSSRGYYVVVMDGSPGSYEIVGVAGPFTGDQLRASPGSTYEVTGSQGDVRAEIALSP